MANILILVHGFMDTSRRMDYLSKQPSGLGWTVLTPSLQPSNGSKPIEQLAEQLQSYILENTGAEDRIDLIGFSMGGLICRYYLQFLDGLTKTDRLITISTPHHGTWTAYLIPAIAIKQMRPGSGFLQRLNADPEPLKQLIFISFYTPLDLIILPPKSSIAAAATNHKVRVMMHRLMVYDRVLIQKLALVLNINAEKTNVS